MPGQIPYYRQKWTSLSEYVKEIKQNFTRLYKEKGLWDIMLLDSVANKVCLQPRC